jgi:hypothetical protein
MAMTTNLMGKTPAPLLATQPAPFNALLLVPFSHSQLPSHVVPGEDSVQLAVGVRHLTTIDCYTATWHGAKSYKESGAPTGT